MKKSFVLFSTILGLAMLFVSFVVVNPANGALVTYNIGGTFGNTFRAGSLPVETYPFPNLFGGSFQGTFSYDLSDPLSPEGLQTVKNVSINILDNTNNIVRTITNYPSQNNYVKINTTYGELLFAFGVSWGVYLDVVDLRSSFDGNLGDPHLSFAGYGILETDRASGGSWSLIVSSAQASRADSGSPVPIPPTVWLLGSGLIGLIGLRRKFFRK